MRLAWVSSIAVTGALAFAACSPAPPSSSRSPVASAPLGRSGSGGPALSPLLAGPALLEVPEAAGASSPVSALSAAEPEVFSDVASSPEEIVASLCNEQPPQEFLMRSRYTFRSGASPEETERRQKLHVEALEYRTRRYGYVRGHGSPTWNGYPPVSFSDLTTFFGIKVRLNKRVIPALACVEAEIRRSCAKDGYVPHVLDGIRFHNTFTTGEVTNHAFGIAIDIDPDRNSCCGCVPPLNTWPRCLRPAASPYERAEIPRCWVGAFEKYGFYWLGNDPIEDTMHFEFLGDPDKIVKAAAAH